MPDRRTIWKRRALLMAALGLLVAIPVTIVVRSGGDEGTQSATPQSEPPQVGKVKSDGKLGVELRLPKGWKRKTRDGIMTLRPRNEPVLIVLSAPGPVKDAEPIHAQAIAAIKAQYRKFEVVDRLKRSRLGGRSAATAIISARHPKKKSDYRILVSTAKGKKQAYLVEVFVSGGNPGPALAEAQVVLNNLKLTG